MESPMGIVKSGCVHARTYATREEAEHALQSVAEREERLNAEDRAWRDGD